MCFQDSPKTDMALYCKLPWANLAALRDRRPSYKPHLTANTAIGVLFNRPCSTPAPDRYLWPARGRGCVCDLRNMMEPAANQAASFEKHPKVIWKTGFIFGNKKISTKQSWQEIIFVAKELAGSN